MKQLLTFAYHRLAALSCDAGIVCISEPGREERGKQNKIRKERCVLFIFPCYILCMLVRASMAKKSWTLSNVGYAGQFICVQASDGMPFQALIGLSMVRDSVLCCIHEQQFCRWKHMTPSS